MPHFLFPPLVFAAAATAPPLVIGARTKNFRIQWAVAFQHDRSPAPPPFIAIKGPLTKQKRLRNQSETWQKQEKKATHLHFLLGAPYLLPTNVSETKWQSYGFHCYFSCFPTRHGYETAAVAPTIARVFPALASFLYRLLVFRIVSGPQGFILVSNGDCDLLWRKVVQI